MSLKDTRRKAPQVVAVSLLLALAFIMGRSSSGGPNPAPSPSTNQQVVDESAVAILIGKLLNNPQDTEALWTLGNAYFSARNFVAATPFYERLVKVTPKDDGAWIAVGAAAFNGGDNNRALVAWQRAAELNPKNAEAFYNLGFWYLAQVPSQEANAIDMWQKVIDIDDTSDFAKDVMSRMASASTPSPTK